MFHFGVTSSVLLCLLAAAQARAGLYYSGEAIADLPSQWRGFLLDQRSLRNIAVKPATGIPANPLRARYEQAANRLEQARRHGKLKADELADLGALYLRLGDVARAVEILRTAQRDFPHHFRIAANLATAWQLQGDLHQAAASLQQAVRLAPGNLQKAEELQLRLIQQRQRLPGHQELDNLFGIRYVDETGQYEPGKLAATERKKLPSDAVALLQQVALWLPADGRLLWQLAELANAHGDVRTAAAIMDGCVTEFGMSAAELRRHRQLLRAAADAPSANADAGQVRTAHQNHAGLMKPRSRRPLRNAVDTENLPAIDPAGINTLPWAVLADTSVDRQFKPTFARYLQELDGKRVSLSGFIQPVKEELELGSFLLIEYPVGCWFCEMPEVTNIVLVELEAGKTTPYKRSLIKVTGELHLNFTVPEKFLYEIRKAEVTEVD
jgi:tetratricopeptide (TPR) repeat protein